MAETAFNNVTRRHFLHSVAAGALATSAAPAAPTSKPARPRVAAIFTEFRFRSHAYNILENFFAPYLFRGKLVDPGVDVVAFYADQFPAHDMAREVSRRFKVPLFKTIGEALCVGGKELAVDAVLSIGEHGDYPFNKRGQQLYPRKRFFDESLAVMQRSRRFVPFFNDKHLSYRWDEAKAMYDAARRHKFPLLAGSSVPLAQRVPAFELPDGAEIEEAVAVHGGGLETYDFHGLEVLQSIVEGRSGGETGVSRVELLSGELYKGAVDEGRWSGRLVKAALAAEKRLGAKRQPRPVPTARFAGKTPVYKHERPKHARPSGPHALLVEYKDGLQASVLRVGSDANRWAFACKLKGEKQPRACAFYNGPWGNRCLFKALSHAIQHLFVHRAEPYPAERTLLTTGVLDAAMHSYEQWGKPQSTPHLELAYKPIDWQRHREDGTSWKRITIDTPQPYEFSPGDARLLKPR